MYQQGHEKNFAVFGLAQESLAILTGDLPLPDDDPLIAEEVVQFRFLRSALSWLDISLAITAGTAPILRFDHFCPMSIDSRTKLENLMGCKNEVMLWIARIATLTKLKSQAVQEGRFDCLEFERTVCKIRDEMQESKPAEDARDCEDKSAVLVDASLDSIRLITRLFTCMATIYIHIVLCGYRDLELLDATIVEAMELFQTKVSISLMPALVCPLFFIGSVAKPEDEDFFRELFASPPLLNPALKHREKVLPVLEEIWKGRQTAPGFGWNDVLELTHSILLI